MSLLSDLVSSTSVVIFGPPAPVAKDPLPPISLTNPPPASPNPSASPTPTSPTSIKEALLSPNLGLGLNRKPNMTKTKTDELPLPPPPPEPESSAASVLLSTGASAISLLGSAVWGVGSAAASVLSPTPEPVTDGKAAAETTMLANISTALLARAVSVRDAALDSATSLASSATHAIGPPSNPTPPPSPPAPRRASTLPIQYTASGEPFSSDPSISAMQRIPDHPCGHHPGLTHCCSAPDVLATDCTCTCSTATQDGCECTCHLKKQSGHFHRVEQLVKGTKRVVRDIKNVL